MGEGGRLSAHDGRRACYRLATAKVFHCLEPIIGLPILAGVALVLVTGAGELFIFVDFEPGRPQDDPRPAAFFIVWRGK
jgi:hypothetical protein